MAFGGKTTWRRADAGVLPCAGKNGSGSKGAMLQTSLVPLALLRLSPSTPTWLMRETPLLRWTPVIAASPMEVNRGC